MVSIKQKVTRLRNKLRARSTLSGHKTITVKIDRKSFKNGYDPLVNTIDYGYSKMAKITVNKNDQLAKLKNCKKAVNIFNEWLSNRKGDKGRSGKQKPYCFDELKKLDVCKHEFGECLIGAANKTKSGFKVRFMNDKGSDSYVHHVSVFANSTCENCIHSRKMLETVSSSKKDPDARTISHLCGNGGCARPGHLRIEKKTVNDERTHCHFLLRRSQSLAQSEMIRLACPHTPRCFVNIYKINKPYY
uniref:Putative homing endonuclease n=1 Tax=Naegleria andersoni TaxID=5764 RepID=Q25535_NAEAN|nr:small subunit ribosomal RNA [Naegleria andersoni]CAA78907.1 putative homing endonuclease [Naegleria andersoni]prf//2114357D group I intron ORF in SSUrDNA [Naegleria andersoni]